jgi:hypothetical protein
VSVLELFTGEVSWETGIAAGQVLESYVDRAGASGMGADGLPLMPVGVVQVLRKCFRQKPEDGGGRCLRSLKLSREFIVKVPVGSIRGLLPPLCEPLIGRRSGMTAG